MVVLGRQAAVGNFNQGPEVGWLMRRYNPVLNEIFDRVCGESKAKRKIAVVATARRLLVMCWAMLRDGTTWSPPTPPEVAQAMG